MKILKHCFVKLIFIFVGMLILATPLLWLQIYYPHQTYLMSKFVVNHFRELTIFRLLLIAAFFMMWSRCINYCARIYQWSETKKQFWLSQRFRITVWLLIFEILVCENVLGDIIL